MDLRQARVARMRTAALQRSIVPRQVTRHRTVQCNAGSTATVKFRIHRHVSFGEVIKLVGGHAKLGNWNPDGGFQMTWNDGDVWTAEVDLPSNEQLDFKCVKAGAALDWEGGDNRSFKIAGPGEVQDLACEWGDTANTHIIINSGRGGKTTATAASAPAAPYAAPAQSQSAAVKAVAAAASREQVLQAASDRLPTQGWMGKDIEFMRSNNHTRERQGQWNLDGLHGALRAIVEGDSKSPNWLKKLDVAKRVLVDETAGMKPGEEDLAAAYIYLHWISTGSLACVEGGSHHRPNHHAELGRLIFRSLEWVIADSDPADPASPRRRSLVARRLHTKIPSFSDSFLVSTPMTRIRDIAHRNDIPHDLKQEIKHTLQNKLHRCAGPEDLIATEAMLARVTATPGQYPEAFVREFRVFTAELQEFFNAGGLRELLQSIIPSLEEGGVAIINTFLAAKAKVDTGGQAVMNDLMEALHTLTTVRALVASGLSSGLRNDAPDKALSMRQRWRLAEIRCEDYAFVLLSRMVNLVNDMGGPAHLAKSADRDWALPIGATVLGVRHMGLSNWETKECMALEHELAAWQKAGNFQDREHALRLKATLDRVHRLAESYSDSLLDVFASRATQLGSALAVPDHAVKVFAEAEIRASVVFQLSRLVSLLQKATRVTSGAAEWDALVGGTVHGKLVEVDRLDPSMLEALGEPVILLVKSADGDEELAAAGPNLRGVVLAHELPHLSHLGVRARQEKVVFACCEDDGYLREKVRPLVGQQVVMAATAEGVSLNISRGGADEAAPAAPAVKRGGSNGVAERSNGKRTIQGAKPQSAMVAGPVNRVSQTVVFAMMDSTPANCGAKAAGCARLEQVAKQRKSPFRTPRGCSLPFGSMEAAIKAARQEREFNRLLTAIEGAATDQLGPLCAKLQELVSSVRPPHKMIQEVQGHFPQDTLLMVRSSSNVEDLAGLSGAGLYDSIPQVKSWDTGDLGNAIAEVWSSLYTRRAVLARRAAGVKQEDAVMAILVQEQLTPEYSFVLHTASPLDRNPGVLYAELAVGMGETLASGTRGSPYRLLVNKGTGEVLTLAFANFSEALTSRGVDREAAASAAGGGVGSGGGSSGGGGSNIGGRAAAAAARGNSRGGTAVAESAAAATEMGVWVVDYSMMELSLDADKRVAVGRRLVEVGVLLEQEFGGAQDVEGALIGDEVYVVQTRPQP